MKKRVLFAVAAVALMAGSAFAQLPPGKWWRRAEIVETLGLTEEQQTKLDGIFRASANDLIDMKAEVEKLTIALRGELDQPQLNRANIQKVAARLNDARGKLFERELTMLADMRGVLTDPQWNRMRNDLDRMRANADQPQGQQGPRRNQGMPRRPMRR